MDKDLDKVINDMYDLEEDIDEGLNEAEDYEVTAEDLEFAKEVYDLIQELIDTDDAIMGDGKRLPSIYPNTNNGDNK